MSKSQRKTFHEQTQISSSAIMKKTCTKWSMMSKAQTSQSHLTQVRVRVLLTGLESTELSSVNLLLDCTIYYKKFNKPDYKKSLIFNKELGIDYCNKK